MSNKLLTQYVSGAAALVAVPAGFARYSTGVPTINQSINKQLTIEKH